MCLKPTHAATVLVALAVIALAAPASAWPFGGSAPAAPKPAAAAPAKPADGQPTKATPEQRALAERQDPMIRVAFWTRETNLDPRDLDAGVRLASALRAMERYDEAADAAQRMLSIDAKYVPAMFEVARAELSANKGFYAIKPLKDAAAADPKDARVWWLLGVAYEQNEQPEQARAAFEQALRMAPDSPAALSNYALFRATHGEPQLAEGMLRKAITEPGAGAAERQNLALVLGLEGKLGEAEQLIRQDLPPDAANQNLAYLRAMNGQMPKPGATPHSDRSWGAVEASENAQIKKPSR